MTSFMRVRTIAEPALPAPDPRAGFGLLRTDRGGLPLRALDVRAAITGLHAGIEVTQVFRNDLDVALEATYVFPLPDRAALTTLVMTCGDRVVQAQLHERGAARQAYDEAIASGHGAAIAEEERPDVFTMRVGNIAPRQEVTIALTLAGPLSLVDGEAEFRFPLVVAPRYIPGTPIGGEQAGDGHVGDTDAVPDASRITPPVLLPGFPNPVALSLSARIDPAGLPLEGVSSSLHAVTEDGGLLRIQPGERVNRDFILRLRYGAAAGADALTLVPDQARDGEPATEGTFSLTVLPPADRGHARPRDVVLLLDRSGSMEGWKMVAARRAASRIVDTLTDADRFAVLTFDHEVEYPQGLPAGLVPGSDRNRYRAVEHLAGADARGGTELLEPMAAGLALLADAGRDRVLVLVTDGQVGNEDQILALVAPGSGVRVHTVGVDQAVNAGFLGRLAALGAGRCELVESEDRLDSAMRRIHRRIGAPLVTDLTLRGDGLEILDGTVAAVPDLFPGVPLVVTGRFRGTPTGAVHLAGLTDDGEPWSRTVTATVADNPALAAVWARGHLRDLADRYAVAGGTDLEREIVAVSLRFGVLCRFTAYLAVDTTVVTDGGTPHRVIQPVEMPAGWEMAPPPPGAVPAPMTAVRYAMPASSPFQPAPQPARAAPASPSLHLAPPGAGRELAKKMRRERRAGFGGGGAGFGGGHSPAAEAAEAEALDAARLSASADGALSVSPLVSPPVPPPAPPVPAAGPVGSASRSPVDLSHGLLRIEARRLRDADAQSAARRRDMLEDLASRLEALAVEFGSHPMARTLAELIAALRDLTVPLAQRWSAAITALEELDALVVPPAGPPAVAGTAGGTRRAFWKRQP